MEKFKNIMGNVAVIIAISAFSLYYIFHKEFPAYFQANAEMMNGLYFIFSCFSLGTVFGLLFLNNIKKPFISSINLLGTLFFNALWIFVVFDFINNDRFRMNHVYFLLIASGVVSLSHILVKWLQK